MSEANAGTSTDSAPDSLPLGADPSRSAAPLVLSAVLYVAWFLALVWMAFSQVGRTGHP